ncbi:hypothetical protein NESM_000513900 [Novymonas esmeraldas]|uniref:Uncharacterized protein n=1 Tax=Novymonas esmeraldas TaxID=1808958 RepID=A0AAW0ET24_9TRYP
MLSHALFCARRGFSCGTPSAPLLQSQLSGGSSSSGTGGHRPPRKLTMSKRRLMMKQKHYCQTSSSAPICAMLMAFTCYMIYQTRYGADDDRMFR